MAPGPCHHGDEVSRVLVTGCAGFIGSHVAEYLLQRGHEVIGADALTDYYGVEQKRANVEVLSEYEQFHFTCTDLSSGCDELLDGVEVAYHLAGQPGVRSSWREEFDVYLDRNVRATQRLLEAATRSGLPRLVFASSSSVYGNAERYPVEEAMRPAPFSPYGVTKLAAEHLCSLYGSNFGLSTVSLRYFTVYGPRQRPDMAFHRLFESALSGSPFPLFGTGLQQRDFTYVGDIVDATVRAGTASVPPGTVLNVAGRSATSMRDVIAVIEAITGRPVPIDQREETPGDVDRTGASTQQAADLLGWAPKVGLIAGLEAQYRWHASKR